MQLQPVTASGTGPGSQQGAERALTSRPKHTPQAIFRAAPLGCLTELGPESEHLCNPGDHCGDDAGGSDSKGEERGWGPSKGQEADLTKTPKDPLTPVENSTFIITCLLQGIKIASS